MRSDNWVILGICLVGVFASYMLGYIDGRHKEVGERIRSQRETRNMVEDLNKALDNQMREYERVSEQLRKFKAMRDKGMLFNADPFDGA